VGRKLQPVEVVTADEAGRHELPERVQAALGELAAAAQEGLLAAARRRARIGKTTLSLADTPRGALHTKDVSAGDRHTLPEA